MESNHKSQPYRNLVERLKSGELTRQQFIGASLSLGLSIGAATFMANSTQAIASGNPLRNGNAFYASSQDAPSASPTPGVDEIPRAGMDDVTRGEGGELRLLQWQAPTTAALHTANGNKSVMVSDMVLEPLMRYLPNGAIIPNLLTDVPAVENGLLSEDLLSATFKIKEGIVWSDGEAFTAEDVKFTWQWIMTPSNASISVNVWAPIDNIEVLDELTALVTFKNSSANWFEPFVGGACGAIYPSHVFGGDPANRNEGFEIAPIGTGPFKVDSLVPNDQVILSMNENYWQPNAPYFSSVIIKGGGDAASSARAVLQTGEYEYAPNLQVEPAVLDNMLEGNPRGKVVTVQGTLIEVLVNNFSDPNTEVDGQRSEMNTPHPFLSDLEVRRALNKAIDRDLIAEEFYGEGQPATANVLTGLEIFESPNTSWEYNIEAAAEILENAGWVMDGDVRAKDGVKLDITYATTVNQVRQKTQAVVKSGFNKIGVKVTLVQIDAGIFFDSAAGNDLNTQHMYFDMAMWGTGPGGLIPTEYMGNWYAGPNGENISQKSNNWAGNNPQRYNNPEYDALYDQLLKAADMEDAFNIMIDMNDILINDVAVIPLVNRAADKYAISNDLNDDNVAMGAFELNYWNIANWNRS